MDIYTKEEFESKKDEITKRIKKGEVFIYPTDTVYGIGADATNEDAVEKVREIKSNFFNAWSVIAPGKDWILNNFSVNTMASAWLFKLPGPYTIILNITNKMAVVQEVNLDKPTLGIRIPNNFFSSYVQEIQIPILTTSANVTGEKTITEISEIEETMKEKVNFVIDGGKLEGSPSTLVDLSGDSIRIKKR